jgi:rhamnogalacturonan endolyase
VDISSWAVDYVKAANTLGIIQGMENSTFSPKSTATRAQAVVIIKRLLEKLSNNSTNNNIILQDSFTKDSASNWVVESEDKKNTAVNFGDGILETIAPKGLTVWNKQKLSGNYTIEFDATMVSAGGSSDRISDLNCFWNATDPANLDNFFADSDKRGGFPTYNPLKLYYVGYGGNNNTTTRFRKYDAARGSIIKEYTKQPYLLEPNKDYKIKIEVNGSNISYYRNDEKLFDYDDASPFKEGYFGFRTTTSHIKFQNFKVSKI